MKEIKIFKRISTAAILTGGTVTAGTGYGAYLLVQPTVEAIQTNAPITMGTAGPAVGALALGGISLYAGILTAAFGAQRFFVNKILKECGEQAANEVSYKIKTPFSRKRYKNF